jgi:hypothetical protein
MFIVTTSHQLHGHIGEKMDGIKIYSVCIVFNVEASDDEEALGTIADALPRNRNNMSWSWVYTTLTEGERI